MMQPYFFPYPGYFRLLASADRFIIHDAAQFRTGRINRTEVVGPGGEPEWLTIPLRRHPYDAKIKDCEFSTDARPRFDKRLRRHEWIASAKGHDAERIRAFLYAPLGELVDYLESGIRLVADLLDVRAEISRSSALAIDPSLRGEDAVIAATKAVGGTQYINAPGGRALYHHDAFAAHGLQLTFLPPYEGPYTYLLPALMTYPKDDIAHDLRNFLLG